VENSRAVQKNTWVTIAIILVAIALVGILAYAMLSAAGFIASPEPTRPAVFITISEPSQEANLDLTWAVTVKGEAAGLFEGNLVVQALDAAGNVITQRPAIIEAPDAGTGGSGPWAVDLNINAPSGSQGQIVAFSTSPADGSWVAEDRIEVGFGESPIKRELVKVEDHLWRLSTLNERSLIENTLLTLQFENFRAEGIGGCNNFKTSYERSGSALNFGFVTSTAKECELPLGIMAQEAAYFNALEQIIANQIDEERLNLIDDVGRVRLIYNAAVMGNIINLVGIELPEDALIYVRLSDISLVDIEAKIIAEQIISGMTQFPVPFSLVYNPKQIIADHTYAIDVRIEDSAGELLFINPSTYHVITAGNPALVEVAVEAGHKDPEG